MYVYKRGWEEQICLKLCEIRFLRWGLTFKILQYFLNIFSGAHKKQFAMGTPLKAKLYILLNAAGSTNNRLDEKEQIF